MHDLLFRPASELAALVRAGEITARELVARLAASGSRRSTAELNAFTQVDADGALAAADAIGAGDDAPVRGRADRDQGQPAGRRHAADLLRRPVRRPRRARSTPPSSRRLRDAGFVIVGTTALPEFGILPTTEPRRNGADAQPVGPRAHARRLVRRRGRGGRRRHGAARARQRRRRLDPHPGRLLRPRRAQAQRAGASRSRPALGDSFLVTDGVLTRTRRRDARSCSTCSPARSWATRPGRRRRPSRSRPRLRASPGRLRIGFTLATPLGRRPVDPIAVRAVRDAAALLQELGPRGRGAAERAVADPGRVRAVLGALRAGRRLDDRLRRHDRRARAGRGRHGAARAGTCGSARAQLGAAHYLAAQAQLQALARGFVTAMSRLRRRADAVARAAPAARSASCSATTTTPPRRSAARASSRPTRRSRTSPASRRSRCRSRTATTACRSGSTSSAGPPTRRRCSRSARSSRPRGRGRAAGRSWRLRRSRTPQRSAGGVRTIPAPPRTRTLRRNDSTWPT